MTDKALRYNTGKAPLSIVLEAPHAVEGLAKVLSFGAQKYARGNFKRGLPYTEIVDSMLRHTTKFLSGESTDEESGLPHVDHILCNALFLSEMTRIQPEFDDRTTTTTTPNQE